MKEQRAGRSTNAGSANNYKSSLQPFSAPPAHLTSFTLPQASARTRDEVFSDPQLWKAAGFKGHVQLDVVRHQDLAILQPVVRAARLGWFPGECQSLSDIPAQPTVNQPHHYPHAELHHRSRHHERHEVDRASSRASRHSHQREQHSKQHFELPMHTNQHHVHSQHNLVSSTPAHMTVTTSAPLRLTSQPSTQPCFTQATPHPLPTLTTLPAFVSQDCTMTTQATALKQRASYDTQQQQLAPPPPPPALSQPLQQEQPQVPLPPLSNPQPAITLVAPVPPTLQTTSPIQPPAVSILPPTASKTVTFANPTLQTWTEPILAPPPPPITSSVNDASAVIDATSTPMPDPDDQQVPDVTFTAQALAGSTRRRSRSRTSRRKSAAGKLNEHAAWLMEPLPLPAVIETADGGAVIAVETGLPIAPPPPPLQSSGMSSIVPSLTAQLASQQPLQLPPLSFPVNQPQHATELSAVILPSNLLAGLGVAPTALPQADKPTSHRLKRLSNDSTVVHSKVKAQHVGEAQMEDCCDNYVHVTTAEPPCPPASSDTSSLHGYYVVSLKPSGSESSEGVADSMQGVVDRQKRMSTSGMKPPFSPNSPLCAQIDEVDAVLN